MFRKLYTESEKMKHTIASYSRDVVITHYCKTAGISRSSIYRWRQKAGARCFSSAIETSQIGFSSSKNVHPTLRSRVKTSRSKPRCRTL